MTIALKIAPFHLGQLFPGSFSGGSSKRVEVNEVRQLAVLKVNSVKY